MFDIKNKAPNSNLILYGLEMNVIALDNTTPLRVLVYTKSGTHVGHEMDANAWTKWLNVSIIPNVMDMPTYVPQDRGIMGQLTLDTDTTTNAVQEDVVRPLYRTLAPRERIALYVSITNGPHLRHADNIDISYYQDTNLVIMGNRGHAKRWGWDGGLYSERTFCGGLHYYLQPLEEMEEQNDDHDIADDDEEEEGLVQNEVVDSTTTLPSLLDPLQMLTNGEAVLLPGLGLLTKRPTQSPTLRPTMNPTTRQPTISSIPSFSPTFYPTLSPSQRPTDRPTASPIAYEVLTTKFETGSDDDDDETETETDNNVKVAAGHMFDIKSRRSSIEINEIGFNTYLTIPLSVQLYIRPYGESYVGYEETYDGWNMIANITVTGMGIGKVTYIPYGSFEPLVLSPRQVLGMYLHAIDGPYICASPPVDARGSSNAKAGEPYIANSDLVLYIGVGKRMTGEVLSTPRVMNVAIQYENLDAGGPVPTTAPTMTIAERMKVATSIFPSSADAYVDSAYPNVTYGTSTQLLVDGSESSQKVSLIQFDLSILNGQTKHEPTQVLSASLRLYSMDSQSMFGGYVHIIPNGRLQERLATWDTVSYASKHYGNTYYVGKFRSIWPNKFYDIDVTSAFRNSNAIPRGILVRLSSDQDDVVAYRSRNDNDGERTTTHDNGPQLTVNFVYEPDTNKVMARSFGSDPPTNAPTVVPEWANAKVPSNRLPSYFNYNPNTLYGPDSWGSIEEAVQDDYYESLRGLDLDTRTNRCGDGTRQSPRDLCETNDKCIEWHEPRPRAGGYGLHESSSYRPQPVIMSNKLRVVYPQRDSEWDRPEPPGVDFAHNVFQSGIQDLTHIDIKVRSEHRLCGKQYDAEMQLFHVHKKERDFEALSILINAGESNEFGHDDNSHFQILLDFFQREFDYHVWVCAEAEAAAAAAKVVQNDDDESSTATTDDDGTATMNDDTEEWDNTDDQRNDDDVPSDDDNNNDNWRPRRTTNLRSLSRTNTESSTSTSSQGSRNLRGDPFLWDPLEPWYMLNSIHFWAYEGSITEPPCFQDIHWRVIDVPMKISMKQYFQLKRLMFDHVDPDTCKKTSTHYEESNARPVQAWTEGNVYRCKRSDYMSDMERKESGSNHGFREEDMWMGVDNLPYITPEFPEAG
jgi:hypothetical protein